MSAATADTASLAIRAHRRARIADRVLLWTLRAFGAVAAALVFLIALLLVGEALPALRHVGFTRWFTDSDWHPASGLFNLTPMLTGTLLAMTGSVLIATPLGVLSAIFCHY